MNNRELLELAAKAAGIEYTVNDDEYYKTHSFFGLWLTFHDEPSEYARRYWNPLTDDGDALRLAVNLMIAPTRYQSYSMAYALGNPLPATEEIIEWHSSNNNDPYVATRRAIVRAAAEIGKNMKGSE